MGWFRADEPENFVEHEVFRRWLKANNIRDYGRNSDYDYFGAFKAGLNKGKKGMTPRMGANFMDKNASDYDNYGAYKSGLNRGKPQGNQKVGHFNDKFKYPWHPKFSNESQYYKPGMPAVDWSRTTNENNPMPLERGTNDF
jgi:hypothetical protein